MREKRISASPRGIILGDICYALFRHKWKIAGCTISGILAAAALYLTWTPIYQSEAKLLIRYVQDTKAITPGIDAGVKSPDRGGENIINSELEILTSLDLARQVAEIIGPEKILAPFGGGKNVDLAAETIKKHMFVEVPRRSSVVRVSMAHPDHTLVQPILIQIIDSYFRKHIEIHRAVGIMDDFLSHRTDDLRNRLAQTEEDLRKAKTNAGIINLDDTKKTFSEQIAKAQQAIFDAQAELAERQAAVNELGKLLQADIQPTSGTNGAVASPDKTAEYRNLCNQLDSLEKKEQELLLVFTRESSLVKGIRGQISEAEQSKQKLEKEHPGLLALSVAAHRVSGHLGSDPRMELATQRARVVSLESKIKVLTNQLAAIRMNATSVDEKESSITELQRKKEREETQYRYYTASLEQARIDQAMGAGKISNINKVQEPSPPFRAASKLLIKMAMAVFGGLGGGLGLALLIEFYLDTSLKRPAEIETKIGVPLFISIPRMKLSRNGKQLLKSPATLALPAEKNGKEAADSSRQLEQTRRAPRELPWKPRSELRLFHSALRDRLITYFEINNLTHKPKLVALTSCAKGSGVSTTAAGLAASLSETGEGNVLLVDMNLQNSAAHEFFKGDLLCGLDDALEAEKRQDALVRDNLYVVKERNTINNLPCVLPKRFKNLVPRLKASDYDYIIFDMPPVSHISITPYLARFMDMVIMVVESEKTDREAVKRASDLLAQYSANFGIVLNKSRSYLPKRLQEDI